MAPSFDNTTVSSQNQHNRQGWARKEFVANGGDYASQRIVYQTPMEERQC